MTVEIPQVVPKGHRPGVTALATLLSCVVLGVMPLIFRLDGKPHGEWLQFLGRFHPLVVHLPIGLILLLPLLELTGRTRPALREAAGLVLWLSVFACLIATILGFLLAYGSGDASARVTRHMWGGITLTIVVALCSVARSSWWSDLPNGGTQWVYPSLLPVAVVLMLWATHQGGALAHGDQYLTDHAPAVLKQWPRWLSSRADESAAPDSFYSAQIQPIMKANCVSCHGPSKVKGKLRLDSYARLMRGGDDGAVVTPGDAAKSLLFQRITLSADHKKFMPSEGKPPVQPREIAMIKAWIEDGASPTATSVKGFAMPATEPAPKIQVPQESTKASKTR